jgi:uncharacterized protein YndB with AHSA1/START domain
MNDPTDAGTAGQMISITRDFDAPREQLFRAWLEPEEVAAWYGPEHMEAPVDRIRIEPRIGGRWELTMVSPGDGAEFSIGYEIVELVEPALIVLRSDPMPQMGMAEPTVVRVELEEREGKTRMSLSDGPYPSPGADRAEAGWQAALENLSRRVAGVDRAGGQ